MCCASLPRAASPGRCPTCSPPPAAAIRRHYAALAIDPRSWLRLAGGKIDLGKLFKGLRRTARRKPKQLADEIVAAITGWGTDARIVLAEGDSTAIDYVATASHSFARPEDTVALEAAMRRALR